MKKKQKFCGILSAMLLVTFSMAVHAGNVMPRNIDDYKLFTSGGEQYRAKFNVEPYYTSTSLINLEGLGRKHNLKVKMEVYKRDISADYIYYEATYEKSDYAVSVLVERTATANAPISKMSGFYYVDGRDTGVNIIATPSAVLKY